PAPVDREDMAGDVGGGVGGEEDGGSLEIVRGAPAAGGDAAEDFGGAFFVRAEGGGVVGGHVAWRYGVDRDLVLRQFVGENFGQAHDRGFAGGVRGNADAA